MGSLRVKFWGTRGLVSSPGKQTAIFGGNTPCVQLLYRDHLIIIDTGFGVCNFGEELMPRIDVNREELKVHIFFTHFHWDHIQGLPFFMPIYFAANRIDIHSPESKKVIHDNLDILFDGSYSPFEGLMAMPAEIKLHRLAGTYDIDGLKVDFKAVDHGADVGSLIEQETYAYKFTSPEGESVTLITDHEARSSVRNTELINFAKGTDLLIHDAQYIEEEYTKYMGWGHSTSRQALDNAIKIDPGMTLLTHHDPQRTDRELLNLHRHLIQVDKYRGLNFEFAREDHVYEVKSRAGKPAKPKKAG